MPTEPALGRPVRAAMFLASISCAVPTTAVQESAAPEPWYAKSGYPCFGEIVGAAGDVDGDGVLDFVIGDPGYSRDHIAPAFWVVSGKDGNILRLLKLPDEGAASLEGGCMGYRVDGGVDIDHDGVPDLLIASQPIYSTRESLVYVVSGKTFSVMLRMVTHGSRGDRGHWARFIGDFDHDGTPDIGILDPTGGESTALLTLYSGVSGRSIWNCPLENEGRAEVGGFVEAGDVDGDGRSDFAVVMGGGRDLPASLRLYSGATKKRLWEHLSSENGRPTYAELVPLHCHECPGAPLLAVSFHESVDVVKGETGVLVQRFALQDGGTGEGTGYGRALASLGLKYHFGDPDLLISEPEFGPSIGRLTAVCSDDGLRSWTLWSPPDSSSFPSGRVLAAHPTTSNTSDETYHFGYQVAAVGDLDEDGVDDLLVGSWAGDSIQPGLARLISGKVGSTLVQFRRKGDDLLETRIDRTLMKARHN